MYHEVWHDSRKISQHRELVNAYESLWRYALSRVGPEKFVALVAWVGGTKVTLTSEGRASLRLPDGLPAPAVTWDAQEDWPSLENVVVNTGFSVSVRDRLNGANAATATLAVSSGFSLPTGFALGANNLTQSGATPGSGTIRLSADGIDMPYTLPISSVAAGSADSLAPSVPRILSVTRVGGANRVAIQQGSDPHPVGTEATGVKEVDLEHSLNSGAWSVIETIDSGGPGLTPVFSLVEIGAQTASASATQTGADVLMSAHPAGNIWGTADSCAFFCAPFTGDLNLIITVPNYTSSYEWSKVGLMFREDLDADSKALWLAAFTPANGRGVKTEKREAKGGSATSGTRYDAVNLNSSVPIWINKTGNVFTTYYWANGWQQMDQFTIPFASQYYAGLVIGETNNTEVTANLTQLTAQNLANLTYDHTIATAGTHNYRARQRDLQP